MAFSAKDKAADKRLLRTYGITLSEYDEMLANQDGGCDICGSKPKSRRLHVDHDHRVHKVPITVDKNYNSFIASAFYKGVQFYIAGATKQRARQLMRLRLMRASIRGILCWPCNRGLRVFFDDPKRLRKSAEYLEEFSGKKN